ncbi:MAG TPA: rhodanese-like domain-containing protein [Solirubrobacteraceae bacterium]|jgi:rhodanese-related sulfurtransferase|nr:rhodanese-like domain-containing protein [Solirubrobacteraceae bacterium]
MRTVAQMVAEARQRIENLSVEETARELEGGEALLIDIREPGERAQNGAIEGSLEAPRGMLEFFADPESPYHREELVPDRRVILHCAGGGRSALAAATLKEMGYTRVAHMDGGLRAWKESGRPLSGGS